MSAGNGIPADQLRVTWRESKWSNPSENCVEVAALPDGDVAVRNSRHPSGCALIYTRAEVRAFVAGVKDGEFDDLDLRPAGERLSGMRKANAGPPGIE
jgi:hypothetical protein